MNAHDPRMLQPPQRIGFPRETGQEMFAVREILGEHFDGDFAAQNKLPGFPDIAHAAPPDVPGDFKPLNFRGRLEWVVRFGFRSVRFVARLRKRFIANGTPWILGIQVL